MTKQLLFYEQVAPISQEVHATLSVGGVPDFRFAAQTNSVPLMTVEFSSAVAEYPIVFAGAEDNFLPVAVLGLAGEANAFVDDSGAWSATYIPAFVRRYPFVFTSSDDGKTLVLCIDESFSGCDKTGKTGQRLFTDDGERTPFLAGMLDFVNRFQAEHQRTQTFGKLMKDLDILEPMQAELTSPDGEKKRLAGFMAVNRDKLKALSDEQLVMLVRNDALELIHLHLNSLRNFQPLADRSGPAASDNGAAKNKSADGKPADRKTDRKKSAEKT